MFSRYIRKYYPDRAGVALHVWVSEQSERPIDEHEFRRNASRCLANGEFLLLIVAERIADSTEELIEFVNSTPGLAYSLRLIELACYRLEQADRPILIIPRVVARTTQVERAVIRVHISDERDVAVTIEGPPILETATAPLGRKKEIESRKSAPLLVDSQTIAPFVKTLQASGIVVRNKGALSFDILFPPVNNVEISGFWIQNNEKLFVHRGLAEQLKDANLSVDFANKLWSTLHAIDESFPTQEFFVTRQFRGVKFSDLADDQKLAKVATALCDFAKQIPPILQP